VIRAGMIGLVGLALAAGCASVDVYTYQPRALPNGSQALAVVSWSLHDLRNISWSYGEPDPDTTRRALVEPTRTGLSAAAQTRSDGSPLDLSYYEIIHGVRMVTQLHGTWTVYIYDKQNRLIQLEFSSYAAARLFLDASYALATQT